MILNDFGLNDFIRLVETFGFHLVNLDIREESTNHTSAISDVLNVSLEINYEAMDEKSRISTLEKFIKSDISLNQVYGKINEASKKVIDVFTVMIQLRNEISMNAFGNYVISMTHHASHVFEVLALSLIHI